MLYLKYKIIMIKRNNAKYFKGSDLTGMYK